MLLIVSFIHLLGAIAMGFYLLLPFVIGKLASLSGDARKGFLSGTHLMNRIAQFVLIVQLLTGGYMMSKGSYSVAWMVATVVLLILIGAFSGMLGGPIKRIMNASVDANSSDIGKIRMFSLLVAISYLLIIIIMFNPGLLA